MVEEEEETTVAGKAEPGVGVVLAVKPGGGGGRLDPDVLAMVVAIEPVMDESAMRGWGGRMNRLISHKLHVHQ